MLFAPGARGADYATPLDPAAVAGLGYRYVIRYICGRPTHWKQLRPAERDAIHAAGLGLGLVWETFAARPLAGAAAGHQDGQIATVDAARLGYPEGMPILVAVDIDVTASDQAAVVDYWEAFRAACGHPAGVYGDWDIIDAVHTRAALCWQANAAWWSKPAGTWDRRLRIHPATHVRQHLTLTTPAGVLDPNTALRPFTLWHPDHQLEPPTEVPTMRHVLIRCNDANAVFRGVADDNGEIFDVEWLPGDNPATPARIAFLSKATVHLDAAGLKLATIHGQLPYGDTRRDWCPTDFALVNA